MQGVADGDTLFVSRVGAVRLIGVDTPETSHPTKPGQFMGKEAAEFVKKLVIRKIVALEFDEERKDKYNRTLAYVYLKDGRMLNAELIKQGYAVAYTRFPFRHMQEFVKLEAEARQKGIGLWARNGLAEYDWLQEHPHASFTVFEMANRLWGVQAGDYACLRIPSEKLMSELDAYRLAVHEYSPKDLKRFFEQRGCHKTGSVQMAPEKEPKAAKIISWEDAGDYIGEWVTVKGKIVKTHNSGKACFLNFHNNWKKYFTAVIFSYDFYSFPRPPEKVYLNKTVHVTGLVKDHEGKPEIILQKASQIKIVE